MRFIKCPRCELNYIRPEEQFCSVCRSEMRGDREEDPFELCSVCGENPCMPGKDVCQACYKEMTQQGEDNGNTEQEDAVAGNIEMEDVAEMEEIDIGADDADDMPAEVGDQISLEEERDREDREAEDEEEKEDD